MTDEICSDNELRLLTEAVPMRLGRYFDGRESFEFDIDLDARPLAGLITDAAKGHRVYELLSIARPGDLLSYFWVHVADSAPDLAKRVTSRFNRARRFSKPLPDVRDLAFSEFDGFFYFGFDDTEPIASLWLQHRKQVAWRAQLDALFPVVLKAQAALRKQSDFLTQHEIALMLQRKHRIDYELAVGRDGQLSQGVPANSGLPSELFDLIISLVKRADVRSVSCPLDDYWLWRELVAEQVRRSIVQNVPPMEALRLNGPEKGIAFVRTYDCWQACDWGGEIHIPYEGFCGGDLFIPPKFLGIDPELARLAPTLSGAVFGPYNFEDEKSCKYCLTKNRTLGEIASATRTECGEWVLYSAKTITEM